MSHSTPTPQTDRVTDGMESTPYPASWLDRLLPWIDRLPGPAWIFYVAVFLLTGLVSHAVRWLEGSLPIAAFDPARLAEIPLALYFLALMHYLNATARKSFQAFRPALAGSEARAGRLAYELTTLPRSAGLACLLVGLVLGAASVTFNPGAFGLSPASSWPTLGYTYLLSIASMIFVAAFILHTIRQLRLVSQIHRMAGNINLFQKVPVYAFSTLTVRTGIGILILFYYYIYTFFIIQLFGPYPVGVIDLSIVVVMLFVAAASFVLPLNGMHHRLVEEKTRLSAEAERRFETTLLRLHHRLDTDSMESMDDLNKALASLVIERETLSKISTWPWRPDTLRSFLTTVALPVLIWLVTGFLGRWLAL